MPIIPLDKIEKFPDMILNEYEYKGFTFQRVTGNLRWHVLYDNHIVNIGQYRHDLEGWVDKQYKNILPELHQEI